MRAAVFITSPATIALAPAGVASSETIASPVAIADPHVELERIVDVQRHDRVADVERGANGAFGVVLVRDRHAEDGDDGVADVLLDRAAVALSSGRSAS